MKRVGIIGYSNCSGLGQMTLDLIKQFNIQYHLIIPGEEKGTDVNLSKAEHKYLSNTWAPSDQVLRNFLSLIDVLITVETTYHGKLFEIAKEMRVKTIFLPMFEWFEWQKYLNADTYICTSKKTHQYLLETNNGYVNDDSILYMPWPVDTDKFIDNENTSKFNSNMVFLHNAGFGGLNWRKGTVEATEAFMSVDNSHLSLILRAQFPLDKLPNYSKIIMDHRIIIDNRNWDDNSEMYKDADVYLYPARYDGQALVAEEAMSCGMPVFVTDAEPMNEFSKDERFKIKLKEKIPIQIHNHSVDMNMCDIEDLKNKIIWCVSEDLSEVRKENRKIIEEGYSWHVWKQKYLDIISS